jgi:hypothetical protein
MSWLLRGNKKKQNTKLQNFFKKKVWRVGAIRSGVAFPTTSPTHTRFGEFQEINRDTGLTMLL